MKKAKKLLTKLLYPPIWMRMLLPFLTFPALIYIFFSRKENSMPAYVVYAISAYCLVILVIHIPKLFKRIKSTARHKISNTKFGGKYLNDLAFRGNISIYQGMLVNFFYVIFRIAVGILHASVWFIAMAVYYLILGGIRLFLVHGYRHCNEKQEVRYYHTTAWFLFLLNIPMGAMILLMVWKNNGYSYPGYVIYISAMYTFYTLIISVINLVRFRKLGNPILSAAKVLNFIAALMSLLGLQTAMIAQFSADEEHFRRVINACTGTGIWATVIITAIYMLIRSKKLQCEVVSPEQV